MGTSTFDDVCSVVQVASFFQYDQVVSARTHSLQVGENVTSPPRSRHCKSIMSPLSLYSVISGVDPYNLLGRSWHSRFMILGTSCIAMHWLFLNDKHCYGSLDVCSLAFAGCRQHLIICPKGSADMSYVTCLVNHWSTLQFVHVAKTSMSKTH